MGGLLGRDISAPGDVDGALNGRTRVSLACGGWPRLPSSLFRNPQVRSALPMNHRIPCVRADEALTANPAPRRRTLRSSQR